LAPTHFDHRHYPTQHIGVIGRTTANSLYIAEKDKHRAWLSSDSDKGLKSRDFSAIHIQILGGSFNFKWVHCSPIKIASLQLSRRE